MTIAEVLKVPNVEISSYSADELLAVLQLPLTEFKTPHERV